MNTFGYAFIVFLLVRNKMYLFIHLFISKTAKKKNSLIVQLYLERCNVNYYDEFYMVKLSV